MDRPMLIASGFIRDGQLFLAHRPQFDRLVSQWPNCRTTLRLEETRTPVSDRLRGYYWGVCVHRVAEEIGETAQDAHDLLKELHLPRRLHAMRGGPICWRCARVINGSTTKLANDEMWEMCSDIHHWASTTIGIVIPDPDRSHVVAA